MQGMVPSASSSQRWKHEYLSNMIALSNSFHPVIALTETWLEPEMNDSQVDIRSYNVFRADREERIRGGALLYIHEQIPISSIERYDDNVCQAVVCVSSATSFIYACVYKPCDATDKSFSKMLQFLHNSFYHTAESYRYTKVVLGDLNFPNLWKVDGTVNAPKSNNEHALINFMNDHFLCQYVDIATRQNNILDLCITNNDRLVQHVKSEKLDISDHNIVNILNSLLF